jgi:chaperonin cofactor prefoldin
MANEQELKAHLQDGNKARIYEKKKVDKKMENYWGELQGLIPKYDDRGSKDLERTIEDLKKEVSALRKDNKLLSNQIEDLKNKHGK